MRVRACTDEQDMLNDCLESAMGGKGVHWRQLHASVPARDRAAWAERCETHVAVA
jgi:hypothetical protein